MEDRFRKFHELRLRAEIDVDFDDALEELQRIEEQQLLPAHILVLKGMCILLSSEESPYNLSDAEAAFQAALAIDADNFDATIELAAFYNTVQGDPEKALPLYEKALRLARSQFTEAVRGYARCYAEVNSPEKALKEMARYLRKPVEKKKVDEVIAEIKALR